MCAPTSDFLGEEKLIFLYKTIVLVEQVYDSNVQEQIKAIKPFVKHIMAKENHFEEFASLLTLVF